MIIDAHVHLWKKQLSLLMKTKSLQQLLHMFAKVLLLNHIQKN